MFGLGKLGGVALGYASDIELLFVYSANGDTTGGEQRTITNDEFFEQLARESSRFIKTKREGISQVDLRLRPYGNEGPLASSLRQFRGYYCPMARPIRSQGWPSSACAGSRATRPWASKLNNCAHRACP